MINDLGDLTKFLKLCRKQGVQEIRFGGVNVIFGVMPRKDAGDADDDQEIPTDEPTMEQLMFLSAGVTPP